MKIFNGSSWSEAKNLKIYNGSSFVNAKKSWIYDGSVWKIHYPGYPVTQGISTSISGNQVVGSTLIAISGNWKSDPAYAPESYTYQWYKNGAVISGAINNTYVTQISDVGSSITVIVNAINQRGSTPSESSNSITVTPSNLTGLSLSDLTLTPSAPASVSVTGGTNTWAASWTNTGASTYSVTTNNGSVYYGGGTSAYGLYASAGSATVYVSSVNTSGTIRATWSASTGANGYTVSWSGAANGSANTASTSYDITGVATEQILYVTVSPYINSLYGVSQSTNGLATQKSSSATSGSTSYIVDPIYSPTYVNGSLSVSKSYYSVNQATYFATTGTTISASASSDGTNPTYGYSWEYSSGSSWNAVGGTNSSYTIPPGYNGFEMRCRVSATANGTTVYGYTESTGAIISPNIAPKAVTGTVLYNDNSPHGGSLNYTVEPNTVGVGTGYFNYYYGPTTFYEWEMYKSTTATPGTTLTSSGTRFYYDAGKVSTASVGYFWFRIRASSENYTTYSAWQRVPSSGTVQFT
jgi:hypothetical protein